MGGIKFSKNFMGSGTIRAAASVGLEVSLKLIPVFLVAGGLHRLHNGSTPVVLPKQEFGNAEIVRGDF